MNTGNSAFTEPPATMPCCQVFEPLIQSGYLLISLGFSVRAEHAHRKQGRLPSNKMLGQRISSNHEHGRGKTFHTDMYSPAKRVVPDVSGRPLSSFTDEGISEGHGLNHSLNIDSIRIDNNPLYITARSHPVDQSTLLSARGSYVKILSDLFLIPYFH